MENSRPVRSGTPWTAILSLLSALAYGVSPIDLIPDLIPLLGWVDDGILIPALVAFGIWSMVKSRRRPASPSVIDVPARQD